MSNQSKIEALLQWLNDFDPLLLHNEDDVETKFVIPLFRLLGYEENYRRGKYPIKTYNPGKAGRYPEIDNIYFLTDKEDEQNADNSLLIVEAKEPNHVNLEADVKQAQFYGGFLTPVFLVVTNCKHLIILRRRGLRSEEILFDCEMSDFINNQQLVSKLYNELNFETVKAINERASNDFTHSEYVELESALQQYPNIREILAQGDFVSNLLRSSNSISVIRPKVAVKCKLPVAFDKGSLTIEFSNITRRGLKISIDHETILSSFLLGLQTPLSWNARSFLRNIDDDMFEAKLGRAITVLSIIEAQDLCDCIDVVGMEYKNVIISTEKVLKTWYSELEIPHNEPVFYLCSVKLWLWKLIKDFTENYEYDVENANWRKTNSPFLGIIRQNKKHKSGFSKLFQRSKFNIEETPSLTGSITFANAFYDQVSIWPKLPDVRDNDAWVDLYYKINSRSLRFLNETLSTKWQDHIGVKGIWTYTETKKWLETDLIPSTIKMYKKEIKNVSKKDSEYLHETSELQSPHKMSELKELAQFLRDIQNSLHFSQIKRNASSFRALCITLYNLSCRINSSDVDLSYIGGKLYQLNIWAFNEKEQEEWTYQKIINDLKRHCDYLEDKEYVKGVYADFMCRVFITIIENGTLNIPDQSVFNEAKNAVFALWDEANFENRYIEPYEGSNIWNIISSSFEEPDFDIE